jgi:hypothetical protein
LELEIGPWNVPRRLAFPFHYHASYSGDGARKVRVSRVKEGVEKRKNAMKLFGILIATAALGAALVASGPAAAFRGGGYYDYSSGYGYPYDYSSGYGYPYDYSSGYGYPYDYSSGYGYPYDYSSGYGYPYDYSSGYGPGLAAVATAPLAFAAAATAPLLSGRSVAVGGNYCATPVKTCLLSHTSWVGNGCSCTVYGGHARGTVE